MTTNLTDKNGTTRKEGVKMAGPARPAPVKKDGGFQKASKYLLEVQAELKKTTWPDKPKLIASTKVVLGAVFVTGLFLWVMDVILSFLFGLIIQSSGR